MHFNLMKNNKAALNNERVVQIDFRFLLYWHKRVLLQSRVSFFFLSCYWIYYLISLCLVPIFNISLREFHFILL